MVEFLLLSGMAYLVLATVIVGWLAYDAWSQRRQPLPDAGINIFRSNAEDATEADLLGMAAAIRATEPPPLPRRELPMVTRSPLIGAGWGAPKPPKPWQQHTPGPTTQQFGRIVFAETGAPPREVGPRERPAWATRSRHLVPVVRPAAQLQLFPLPEETR